MLMCVSFQNFNKTVITLNWRSVVTLDGVSRVKINRYRSCIHRIFSIQLHASEQDLREIGQANLLLRCFCSDSYNRRTFLESTGKMSKRKTENIAESTKSDVEAKSLRLTDITESEISNSELSEHVVEREENNEISLDDNTKSTNTEPDEELPRLIKEHLESNFSKPKAKLETKALKAKRPGFTDDRYNETSYYIENGLRKVYPYYFTFTTFTKGRWVGEKILDIFAREFRAHPAEEYERCIQAGTLTVNYEKVPTDYKLKHNDLLANVVHRHETPVLSNPIKLIHVDEDLVVLDKPCSIPVHPCGRYRHNTVVFILAKEYNLKNLRTIHRLDRLTSGLLLFGRTPKKARQMEHQIRNRLVSKEYVCRVEGHFPDEIIECNQPIEVVSYKIGVCKVSPKGKDCITVFQKLGYNGKTSIILCKPKTGRMHQIRVHLQYLGHPVVNDPLYNHEVFGPLKGKGGDLGGKTDEELVQDLIHIHNAENWLGMDGDSELSMFNSRKSDLDESLVGPIVPKGRVLGDDDTDSASRETSPCDESCENASSISQDTSSLTPVDSNSASSNVDIKVTVATQTGQESPDLAFNPDKMTVDRHCYECKVRYRDPKPQDLVMYLHAWKYKGPGWEYVTELPDWAQINWIEPSTSE
ncbi:uncharacterized protein LOC130896656 isoform X1 [Diorhabda carinulata]|uniref:uncharacterized protein LOC130896656 isoform X1 n=1 Tax=Diorhabda carinulata TaxID=1163345 RepID=UPI0025A21F83|nr:uncharacterized protein LOC130896656 isoform X1 [Diorhabda carinulata]